LNLIKVLDLLIYIRGPSKVLFTSYMTETKPIHPFAAMLPPLPPLIILLNVMDLIVDLLPDVLLEEDLLLTSPCIQFNSYKWPSPSPHRPPPSPCTPVLCLKPWAIPHPTKPTPQTAIAAPTKDIDKLSDDSSDLSSIESMSSYESTPWGTPVLPAALSC
jgi:hypothetical protein